MPWGTWARKLGRERIGTFHVLVVVRLLQWPVRALTRPVVRRLPRDPGLVAFGAGSGRFADNAAHLFLHMAENSALRCVWVSPSRQTVQRIRSMGFEAVPRWSREGVAVAARASWYVFSSYRADINLWLSDGAVALNLWHGVGVKRVQRDRPVGAGASIYLAPDGSPTARLFADDRRSPDWLLTTSSATTDILSRAFDVPPQRCVQLGYPRNDHLVEGREPPKALVDPELYDRIARHTPVVGYFPTFRDGSLTLPGGAPVISEMAEIVGSQGGILVFKAHDATSVTGIAGDGTLVLPREADLNTYLGLCDVLVTDYSSVVTDYLVLGRPVVLFWPDVAEYQKGRGFALDPAEVLPGVRTRTTEELYAVLSTLHDIPVTHDTDRLTDIWWDGTATPGASARLQRFITDRCPGPQAEAAVLDGLRAVLGDALDAGQRARLVVRSEMSRRRSSLYFVGVDGEQPTIRWVVKQPKTDSRQLDLPSPVSAGEQERALRLLFEHLEAGPAPVTAPRPLGHLAGLGAYVMEFVEGRSVTDLIRPTAVVAPGALQQAMRSSATVLRAIHSIEPCDQLPLVPAGVSRGVVVGTVRADVVLHGDFAPENVLISGSKVYCLEPDLSHSGPPEVDVTRFLTMLFDAPMFVMGVDLPPVQSLRRRAASTFLHEYYPAPLPVLEELRRLMAESLAARWTTRRTDVLQRRPPFAAARLRLLDRYFDALLTEMSQVPDEWMRPVR